MSPTEDVNPTLIWVARLRLEMISSAGPLSSTDRKTALARTAPPQRLGQMGSCCSRNAWADSTIRASNSTSVSLSFSVRAPLRVSSRTATRCGAKSRTASSPAFFSSHHRRVGGMGCPLAEQSHRLQTSLFGRKGEHGRTVHQIGGYRWAVVGTSDASQRRVKIAHVVQIADNNLSPRRL
jgi:hypothetical protein